MTSVALLRQESIKENLSPLLFACGVRTSLEDTSLDKLLTRKAQTAKKMKLFLSVLVPPE